MEEVWKPCYETDEYEISSEGRVRNTTTGRILKTWIDKRGHEVICIQVNGRQRTRRVSRLVGEAFYGSECDGMDVYHRDTDEPTNHLTNIVIGTRADVIRNTYHNGRKQKHKMRRVQCIETGEIFESITACSESMGIGKQAISRAANNPFLRTKEGLHFIFIDR